MYLLNFIKQLKATYVFTEKQARKYHFWLFFLSAQNSFLSSACDLRCYAGYIYFHESIKLKTFMIEQFTLYCKVFNGYKCKDLKKICEDFLTYIVICVHAQLYKISHVITFLLIESKRCSIFKFSFFSLPLFFPPQRA